MKNKNTPWIYIILVGGLAGILSVSLAWAQFEYYDSYSNSNIDYFPMNPINTGANKSGGSSGTGSAPSSSQKKTTEIAPAPVPAPICTNKPKQNPQNTRSVEIRDESGKVFYLSPPKEEVIGIRAYPETSKKIFKQNDGTETGLIVDDNGCYPKFGYIQDPLSAPPPGARPANVLADTTVPFNRTAVTLDPATGKVYDASTKEQVKDARYDPATKKIYYKDSNSIFGKVFTETSGYVNIDTSSIKTQIQKEKNAAPKNKKLKKKSKTKKLVPTRKK